MSFFGFVPPTFKNFGKDTKDLFKKKYDFDNQLKVINRNSGLTFESGAVAAKSGDIRGYVKFNGATCPVTGARLEGELHSSADQESTATARYDNKLAQGLKIAAGVSSKAKGFKKTSGLVELEYTRPHLAWNSTFRTDLETHRLEETISAGADGLSVGASATVDLSNGAQLTETNFGVNYAAANYTTALYTENNRDAVTGSYYLRVSPTQSVGASLKYDLTKGTRSWTLGSDVRINPESTGRAKVELSSANPSAATVSAAVETRLVNPNMLFSVATQFKVSKANVEATNVGLGLTFGDF